MPSVHEVLRWANRTAVAQEITRRGYRVSPETLNRWYRQRAEVPAVVEHIVFELFGISGHSESPPAWAGGLAAQAAEEAVRRIVSPETLRALQLLAERAEATPPPSAATGRVGASSPSPDAPARGDR